MEEDACEGEIVDCRNPGTPGRIVLLGSSGSLDLGQIQIGRHILDIITKLNNVLLIIILAKFAIQRNLVDLGILGQLTVRLQIPRLVWVVLEDDVRFRVLIVSQANQNNVALIDPHLLAQLAPNVTQTFDAVKAERLQPAVAQHFQYLSVLLTVLLEDQLSLFVFVFVLTTTAVFASLSLVLRHGCESRGEVDELKWMETTTLK